MYVETCHIFLDYLVIMFYTDRKPALICDGEACREQDDVIRERFIKHDDDGDRAAHSHACASKSKNDYYREINNSLTVLMSHMREIAFFPTTPSLCSCSIGTTALRK